MRDGLHLAALSAFALAQPLFDLFSGNPEFFATRGSTSLDIVAFALGLTLLPPLLLLLIELLAGLAHPRLRRAVHLAFVAALSGLVALQALKGIGAPAAVLVAAALGLGALVSLAYARTRAVPSFMSVLSPAPAVFLALFLLSSPVVKLLGSQEADARPGGTTAEAPVVMVLFDELPVSSLLNERGEIDELRYPNFAALAGDSTWFRNATTVQDSTTAAVPALLTGNYPEEGKLPIAADHPRSLFTLLGGDYRLEVFEEATRLCPERICPQAQPDSFPARMRLLASDTSVVYAHALLPDGLRAGLPPISDSWGNFRRDKRDVLDRLGGGREARFGRFVDSVRGNRSKSLAFQHVLLPHGPWQYLPSGRRYGTAVQRIPGLAGVPSFDDPWLTLQAYQRHLLQTGFADRLLGRLLRRLRREGLYERSLIVVAADHGISFHPGVADRRKVTEENAGDVAPVPLLIKAPRQSRARVDGAYVRTIDVLPTIAGLLGMRMPWRTDGRSAFDPVVRKRREVEIFQRSGRRLVIDARSFQEKAAAALRRKLRLFGAGHGGPGLYGIGPHPELLGRRLADLRVRSAAAANAEIDRSDALLRVDPGSGVVPSQITGRISGGAQGGARDLAVSVNGRVVALGRSSSFSGPETFSVFVPEVALRPGANQVELLAVSPRGEGLAFERLARVG